jgi:hypothetical protein
VRRDLGGGYRNAIDRIQGLCGVGMMKIPACLLLGVVCTLALSVSDAYACEVGVGKEHHCYIQIKSGSLENEATIADIESSQMNAIPKGDRLDDEQWTTFASAAKKPWVEVGDTIGSIGAVPGSPPHYATSPVYFWAYFPDGESPYTGAEEWDLGSGPGLGSWFEATEVAAGGGGWCAKLNNVQMGCAGGFPTYANYIIGGMEVAANIPSENLNGTNSGTVETYKLNLKGELIETSDNVEPIAPGGVQWCYEWPVAGHGNWLDFGTGAPPCASGQKHTNVVVGGAQNASLLAVGQTEGEPGTVAPGLVSTGALPNEGYVAPTGAVLPATQLRSTGLTLSSAIGGEPSPTEIESATATLQQAASAMNPRLTVPASTSPEMKRWWNSQADLLVLHGHFTLGSMPRASWANGAPSGTVLDVIIDAHTGTVEATRVAEEAPASLSSLGSVTRLQ